VLTATYPSYVDFDPFIDVAALRALDAFMVERIEHHIRTEQQSFFLNEHRLDPNSAYVPGVREIWLTRTRPGTPYDYLDLDKAEKWELAPAAVEFAPLIDFVRRLPFSAVGRVIVIYDDGGNCVPAHRDHLEVDKCHEFIWMRTNLGKQFYVLDAENGRKAYVRSNSAWFDTVNQFHGADGFDGLSFSIRVDGTFDPSLRQQIPQFENGGADVPALWAAGIVAEQMDRRLRETP
jgi:hypothetical protein